MMTLGLETQQLLASAAVGAATALIVLLFLEAFRTRTVPAQLTRIERFLKGLSSPAANPTLGLRRRSSREQPNYGGPPPNLGTQTSSIASSIDELDELPPPPGLARQASSEEGGLDSPEMRIERHTEDATLRLPNAYLMQRGRAAKPRQIGQRFGPSRTNVVRIALTGGPCAGKSSALDHLTRAATAEGFDVLTAPEVATLYFNASYQLPTPGDESFGANLFTFQKNVLKLQLQLERCMTDLAARTGRPTIVVFDRGLLDCKAYMSAEMWEQGVAELDVRARVPFSPPAPHACASLSGASASQRSLARRARHPRVAVAVPPPRAADMARARCRRSCADRAGRVAA